MALFKTHTILMTYTIQHLPYHTIQYIPNHRINAILYNKRQHIQDIQDNERQNTIKKIHSTAQNTIHTMQYLPRTMKGSSGVAC